MFSPHKKGFYQEVKAFKNIKFLPLIMTETISFEIDRTTHFKNWIKKRFINEVDIKSMSTSDALAWSNALVELGFSLQQQALLTLVERETNGG
jgi:hypothetical protein